MVASEAYYFLAWRSRTAEKICNVGRIQTFDWKNFLILFLTVGEPLFEMIHRNGWAEPNRESIREGFKRELELVIELDDKKSSYEKIYWFRERGASWLQLGADKGRASRITGDVRGIRDGEASLDDEAYAASRAFSIACNAKTQEAIASRAPSLHFVYKMDKAGGDHRNPAAQNV